MWQWMREARVMCNPPGWSRPARPSWVDRFACRRRTPTTAATTNRSGPQTIMVASRTFRSARLLATPVTHFVANGPKRESAAMQQYGRDRANKGHRRSPCGRKVPALMCPIAEGLKQHTHTHTPPPARRQGLACRRAAWAYRVSGTCRRHPRAAARVAD